MESKIKIKWGTVEIEFEGSESFIKEELQSVLDAVRQLYLASPLTEVTQPSNERLAISNPRQASTATVASIAKYINAKSGSDLVMCAVAKLSLVDGKDVVTRSELTDAMKSASAYFKEGYVSNLTSSLNTLTKNDDLRSHSKDRYALSPNSLSKYEAAIATLN